MGDFAGSNSCESEIAKSTLEYVYEIQMKYKKAAIGLPFIFKTFAHSVDISVEKLLNQFKADHKYKKVR